MEKYVYIFLDDKLNPISYCMTDIELSKSQVEKPVYLRQDKFRIIYNYGTYTDNLIKRFSVKFWTQGKDKCKFKDLWIVKRAGIMNEMLSWSTDIESVLSFGDSYEVIGDKINFNNTDIEAIKVNFDKIKKLEVSDIDEMEILSFVLDVKEEKSLGYSHDVSLAIKYCKELNKLGYETDTVEIVRKSKNVILYKGTDSFGRFVLRDDPSKGENFDLGKEITNETIARCILL